MRFELAIVFVVLLCCVHHCSSQFHFASCKDFVPGTCVCDLTDGTGIVDLTPYVEMTKANPLQGTDSDQTWSYYFAFCNALTGKPDFQKCNNKASVCQWADWTPDFDEIIGEPSTTKFEYRKRPKETEPERLALVTQTTSDVQKMYKYIFL